MSCERCNQIGCSFPCMQLQRDEAREMVKQCAKTRLAYQEERDEALIRLQVVSLLLDEKYDEAFAVCEGRWQEAYGKAADVVSERNAAYEYLERWQDWNLKMHHDFDIGSVNATGAYPEDSKGRKAIEERLRAGVVAAEAVARLRAERNAARYDASLLAEMLVNLELRLDLQLNSKALIERHYNPGVIEPNGDTVPHPYRMTPELAAALSGLCVAEDPDPEHQVWGHADTLGEVYLALSRAVERVTQAMRDQQPEIG